ncbi:MAG: selenium-dependent molybdenum cofactor biosynthesis protein YqeB, partial [Bacillota bacterium]
MKVEDLRELTVLLKGGGDLASGIAYRLNRAGIKILVLEKDQPTAVRRAVAFAQAVYADIVDIEGVTGRRVRTLSELNQAWADNVVPVITNSDYQNLDYLHFPVLVDARMLKDNIETEKSQAPLVIGLGPGFTAGENCNMAVETKRGHHLGRVIYSGSTAENTGEPGEIAGHARTRVIHAPISGCFQSEREIGEAVAQGEIVARVDDHSLQAGLSGVIRGLLKPGLEVEVGMKLADIDPRSEKEYCYNI